VIGGSWRVGADDFERSGAGGGSRTLTGLLSPADFLTDHGFRRPDLVRIPIRFAVWTIPSPCPEDRPELRCCPSSLYTFPAVFLPGLARDCHRKRFPRIWAVLHHRFPGKHSSFFSSPLRLPFRHARVVVWTASLIIGQDRSEDTFVCWSASSARDRRPAKFWMCDASLLNCE
jgi:hypothetical protein